MSRILMFSASPLRLEEGETCHGTVFPLRLEEGEKWCGNLYSRLFLSGCRKEKSVAEIYIHGFSFKAGGRGRSGTEIKPSFKVAAFSLRAGRRAKVPRKFVFTVFPLGLEESKTCYEN